MAQIDLIDQESLGRELKTFESSLIEKLKRELQLNGPEEYLTRNEVADLLKVNVNTVDRWAKQGKFSRYGIGDRIFLKRSEVEKSMVKLL